MKMSKEMDKFVRETITKGNDYLAVRCDGGWIITFISWDDEDYAEASVDYVTDDLRAMQLSTTGQDRYEPFTPREPEYRRMHVYAWDGITQQVETVQYVTTDDPNGYYFICK